MSNLQGSNAVISSGYFKKIIYFWKFFGSFISSEFSTKTISLEQAQRFSVFLFFGGDKKTFELGCMLRKTKWMLNKVEEEPVSIDELIQPYLDFDGVVEFDMAVVVRSVAGALAKGIGIVFLCLFITSFFTRDFSGVIVSFPVLIPTGFLILMCIRYYTLIDVVSKKITEYDRIKDSGLVIKSQLRGPLFDWLSDRMDGFKRGKIDNYLSVVYTAKKTMNELDLEYLAFKYTSIVSTYTDSDGNKRNKYDSYQGVLLPCSGLEQITISPDKKVESDLSQWTTVSQDFNKRFKIWCAQELDASRLLSPATILDIEKLDALLGSLNILVCPDGNICLLFKADFDISKNEETLSLRRPKEYLVSLSKDHFSPTLGHCLQFLLKMMAQLNIDKTDSLDAFIAALPNKKTNDTHVAQVKMEGSNNVERAISLLINQMDAMKKTKK